GTSASLGGSTPPSSARWKVSGWSRSVVGSTYRVTPCGRSSRPPSAPGDASRLVPAAALKAVGVRPCAFDSRRLRHAPLAEWLSTGLLIRGGQFDPDAAYLPSCGSSADRASRSYRDGRAFESRPEDTIAR